MTLTVIIGKIGAPDIDELTVKECPSESYDVCNPEFTIYPRRAYRSGSGRMRSFFDGMPAEICPEIVRIRPIIGVINGLPDDCGSTDHNDRMTWFKFWCNRAVELYDDEAGIELC